ncbi:hypothetical protein I5907_00395 [Panacibacter sp. DH6]|uniref:Entericidin n=1 Tax=Panacibacter microcysteis TaxID=2793269 RepID=A0A931DXG7_9BACT|nr:hypothetical protein [Panacibacter microcysteis]MBG9374677.1 hypothetical protein [Panacibacter microcysteis]
MKKVLFVLALGAFAACGSGESTENATDSSAVDTTAVAPMVDTATAPIVDTTVKTDSTAVDTTKH